MEVEEVEEVEEGEEVEKVEKVALHHTLRHSLNSLHLHSLGNKDPDSGLKAENVMTLDLTLELELAAFGLDSSSSYGQADAPPKRLALSDAVRRMSVKQGALLQQLRGLKDGSITSSAHPQSLDSTVRDFTIHPANPA